MKEMQNIIPITERKDKMMGVVDRVFDGARLKLKLNGCYPKYQKQIEEILGDEELRKEQKKVWDQQTLEGAIEKDPAKQEEIWSKKIVGIIAEKLGIEKMDKAA